MVEHGCHWVCCHVRDNRDSYVYVVPFTNDIQQVLEVEFELYICNVFWQCFILIKVTFG